MNDTTSKWFDFDTEDQEPPPRSSHELTYSDAVDSIEGGVVSVRFPDGS